MWYRPKYYYKITIALAVMNFYHIAYVVGVYLAMILVYVQGFP